MRALILVLLTTLALAAEPSRYACLGYSFALPIEFTSAQSSPLQGYVFYSPDDGPDQLFKIVMDLLPADQSASKAEFFNTAWSNHVSRHSWSITGKSRTILGRSVSEAGGAVTSGQNQGRALGWLVPTPSGDYLFLAAVSLQAGEVNQLESIAAMLTSTLRKDP